MADSMKTAFSSADAADTMKGLTRSFAQLRAGAAALSADAGKFSAQFVKMGEKIGLSAQEAQKFSTAMAAAFRKKQIADVESAMRSIARQTGMSASEVNKLARSLGVAGVQISRASQEARGFCLSFTSITKGAFAFSIMSPLIEAARQLTDFRELLNSMMRMDTLKVSYASIFGSADSAVMQLDYLRETTRKLGLEFVGAAEGASGGLCASLLARGGVPVKEIQTVLMHSSSITTDRYIRRIGGTADILAAAFDAFDEAKERAGKVMPFPHCRRVCNVYKMMCANNKGLWT